MKVEVQLINERGRSLPTKDRPKMPVYRGMLRVNEVRNHDLGRTVVTAQLISPTDGTDSTVLPTLHNAALLFLKDAQLRVNGVELVDGIQYSQTWAIKVMPC